MFKTFMDKLASLLQVIVTAVVLFLAALIFTQIVYRCFWHKGFPWIEELSNILFVWAMFLGITLGVHSSSHISIAAVSDLLKKHNLGLLAYALKWAGTLAFFGILTVFGYSYACSAVNAHTSMLNINMMYVYMAIPLCGILSVLFTLEEMWRVLVTERRQSQS